MAEQQKQKKRGFIYYFPGAAPVGPDAIAVFLRERGLDERVSLSAGPNGVTGGPDGGQGWTMPGVGVEVWKYYKDEQEWIECPGGMWLGWKRDEVPGPEDLQKPDRLAGYFMHLGDGNKWVMPVARKFDGVVSLPQALMLMPDGEWKPAQVVQQHAGLWRIAERVQLHVLAQQQQMDGAEYKKEDLLTMSEVATLTAQILGANYRVGPEEVSALRLLTSKNHELVLLTVLDIHTQLEVSRAMAEANKKNPLPPPSMAQLPTLGHRTLTQLRPHLGRPDLAQ